MGKAINDSDRTLLLIGELHRPDFCYPPAIGDNTAALGIRSTTDYVTLKFKK